jgi:15-cis-phytoene desaturase
MHREKRKRVVVLGGGLAGFALASELVHAGYDVEILEKEHYLGGRASNTLDTQTEDAVPIGPHVYVQWYNNFFRFLRVIGGKRLIAWQKNELLEIVYKGQHHTLRFYNLPAPLYVVPWILQFPFMTIRDKLSNIRFVRAMYTLRPAKVEALDSMTTRDLMQSYGVTSKSIDTFWSLIVLSLLNVPIERCSAAEFAMLIQKWAHLKNRRFGFPKVGLGDIFTRYGQRYVEKHGGRIRTGCAVTAMQIEGDRLTSLTVVENGTCATVEADIGSL